MKMVQLHTPFHLAGASFRAEESTCMAKRKVSLMLCTTALTRSCMSLSKAKRRFYRLVTWRAWCLMMAILLIAAVLLLGCRILWRWTIRRSCEILWVLDDGFPILRLLL